MTFFETIIFRLWENLNFPVWTYSIISRCYYKCNKRNLSLIKAMSCRIQNYFFIYGTYFFLFRCFDVFSVIDGRSCSQPYKRGDKPSVDVFQPLSIESGYSLMFSMHCFQINVCKFLIFVESLPCRNKSFTFFVWIQNYLEK